MFIRSTTNVSRRNLSFFLREWETIKIFELSTAYKGIWRIWVPCTKIKEPWVRWGRFGGKESRESPDSPVVRVPCFCKGFDPRSGSYNPISLLVQPKKKTWICNELRECWKWKISFQEWNQDWGERFINHLHRTDGQNRTSDGLF